MKRKTTLPRQKAPPRPGAGSSSPVDRPRRQTKPRGEVARRHVLSKPPVPGPAEVESAEPPEAEETVATETEAPAPAPAPAVPPPPSLAAPEPSEEEPVAERTAPAEPAPDVPAAPAPSIPAPPALGSSASEPEAEAPTRPATSGTVELGSMDLQVAPAPPPTVPEPPPMEPATTGPDTGGRPAASASPPPEPPLHEPSAQEPPPPEPIAKATPPPPVQRAPEVPPPEDVWPPPGRSKLGLIIAAVGLVAVTVAVIFFVTSGGDGKTEPAGSETAENRKVEPEAEAAKKDEAKAKTDKAEAKTDEAKAKTDEAGTKTDEAKAKTDEAEAKTDEAEAKTDEAEAKTDEAEAKTDEAKVGAGTAEAKADEAEAKTDEAKTDKAEAKTDEAEAKTDEAKVGADTAETKTDEAKTDEAKVGADTAEAKTDEAKTDKAEAKTDKAAPVAEGPVRIDWQPADGDEGKVRDLLMKDGRLDALAAWLGKTYRLSRKKPRKGKPEPELTIVMRTCNTYKAYTSRGAVYLCYDVLDRFRRFFDNYFKGEELQDSIVGASMWLMTHMVGHELADRLKVPRRRPREGHIDQLAAWLLLSRAGKDDLAKESGELIARGAVALMRWSSGRYRKWMVRAHFFKDHFITTAHLRDVMCLSYGVEKRDWLISRRNLKKRTARKCHKTWKKLNKKLARKMKRYVRK